MRLRVADIAPCAENEGPGRRFVIWVQGCSVRCQGCFNSDMWEARGGRKFGVRRLYKLIKAERGIEGVTFLGGEPFEQARALSRLARKVQKAGLSVLAFTGYDYEALNGRAQRALLKYTDVLIDGKYIEAEKDYSRPYAGSRNQRYFFLSKRYRGEEFFKAKNRLEITVGPEGGITIGGMGGAEKLLREIGQTLDKKM